MNQDVIKHKRLVLTTKKTWRVKVTESSADLHLEVKLLAARQSARSLLAKRH